MRTFLLILATTWLSAAALHAQLLVEVTFDNEAYLPNEAMVAKIRISNNSGQALTFGTSDDWLTLDLEAENHGLVHQLQPLPVRGEFTLQSSENGIRRIDLSTVYDLVKAGRYYVTATVRVPGWREPFVSKAKWVDIASGVRVFETSFGVPAASGTGVPEVRKYMLQQANRKQMILYARVTSENELQTLNVVPLGPLLSFSRPEPQLDRWSNLHVLFQFNARAFNYCVVTPEGLLMKRETWEYTTSRPILKVADDGHISISGGVKKPRSTDLPPPDVNAAMAAVEAEAAAAPPINAKTNKP